MLHLLLRQRLRKTLKPNRDSSSGREQNIAWIEESSDIMWCLPLTFLEVILEVFISQNQILSIWCLTHLVILENQLLHLADAALVWCMFQALQINFESLASGCTWCHRFFWFHLCVHREFAFLWSYIAVAWPSKPRKTTYQTI